MNFYELLLIAGFVCGPGVFLIVIVLFLIGALPEVNLRGSFGFVAKKRKDN